MPKKPCPITGWVLYCAEPYVLKDGYYLREKLRKQKAKLAKAGLVAEKV